MQYRFFFFLLLLASQLPAQIAINTNGSEPDSSAMLDIQSTSKGLLTPRMTQSERNAIVSPATGLMIYQTDAIPGFYYNEGTPTIPDWIRIGVGNELSGDPRVPIDSVAHFANYGSVGYASYVITEPGSYYLTKNVLSAQSGAFGIVIDADNVVLDLNGYTIIGDRTTNPFSSPPTEAGGTGDGIHLEGARKHITIKNGIVDSWAGSGIAGSACTRSSFYDLSIRNHGKHGLEIDDFNVVLRCAVFYCYLNGFDIGESCVLVHNTSGRNAGYGFRLASYNQVTNCNAGRNGNDGFDLGNQSSIINCISTYNEASGIEGSIGITIKGCIANNNWQAGFNLFSDASISGCTASYNGTSLPRATLDSTFFSGIVVGGNSGYVFNNQCVGNEYAGIAARFAGSQDSKIIGNMVIQNELVGIYVKRDGGLVAKNYVAGTVNGPGYDFRGTTAHGPIIDVRGSGVGMSGLPNAVHPFANFNN
ncbi:MAG: right-handed parallel beta-helix repeat-containing protein [Bacteroidota bacterium]